MSEKEREELMRQLWVATGRVIWDFIPFENHRTDELMGTSDE